MINIHFLICICLCLASTPPLLSDDWPMWRHDAARSAESAEKLPARLEILWRRQLPMVVPAWREDARLQFDRSYEPIVQGKRLYLGCSRDDSLMALDTDTGELLWRFFADGPIRFAPVADDERVFFVSDDGHLYCLKSSDGSFLWKYRGGPGDQLAIGNERIVSRWPARGAPVLDAGVVYFAAGLLPSDGAFVYALDAASGRNIWTHGGSGSLFVRQDHSSHSFSGITPQGYLVISGDTLIVPCGRTTPAILDRSTGRLIAFRGFDPPGDRHPIQKGRAKHGWTGSWFITKDGKPGRDRGHAVVDGKVIGSKELPAVDGKITRVIAADGKVFCVTNSGQLYGFGASSTKFREYDLSRHSKKVVAGDAPDTTVSRVRELLGAMPDDRGYCVLLGLDDGHLLHELIHQSSMFVVAFDRDGGKIQRMRRELHSAGLYGTRATIHSASLARAMALPPYMASLVVLNSPDLAPSNANWWLHSLHPYGGLAAVTFSAEHEQFLKRIVAPARKQLVISRRGNWSFISRVGSPEGARDWTHEYGDAANTLNSGDTLVRAPLSLLWFGGESARLKYFNRASSAPSPLVSRGRMFIQGPGFLHAIDIYTGRILWRTALPSGRTPYKDAATVDGWRRRLGYSAVATDDVIFLATGIEWLKIKALDGAIEARWNLPKDDEYIKEIRVTGETLVATTPRSIQAFSTRTGARIWRRETSTDVVLGKYVWNGLEYGNLGTAVSEKMVYGIFGMSDADVVRLERRGETEPSHTVLIAFDTASGDTIWHHELAEGAHTCLSYSDEFDVLIQAPGYGATPVTLAGKSVVAYRGTTGDILWKKPIAEPGPYILQGDRVITQGHRAYELSSGGPALRRDPLTGALVPWRFHKDYGCNYAIASADLLTFRSGAAGYCDVASTGTGNFGGFRSGCRNSLIPAGGVIASPKFANGCICSYPVMTSMALVPAIDSELWTILDTPDDDAPIVQLGLNFGAPGDRLSSAGTPWYDIPAVGGPSAKLDVALLPEAVEFYRHHSSRLHAGANSAARWIAASGVRGARSISIDLRSRKTRLYEVRLYFAETEFDEPGRRVMNIKVQGKVAIASLDIFAEVGKNRVQVKTISGVSARERITVELDAATGRTSLSGIELITSRPAVPTR